MRKLSVIFFIISMLISSTAFAVTEYGAPANGDSSGNATG